MEYPLGARLRFKTSSTDIGDVRSNAQFLYWQGIINGTPICDDNGAIVAVPVWCVRELREPTTIFVAVAHIVSIEA